MPSPLSACHAGSAAAAPRAPATSARLPLIDAVKGVCCMAIVLHHLAAYGPMSDVVHAAAPAPIDWLYDRARLAVQVFLVLGGFLAAGAIAPQGRPIVENALALAWKRYRRLVPPLLFAVALATLVTALVRPWFDDPSLSAPPTAGQLLAHALLLQNLLGIEALSAGVWYVAIDFQLFVGTALLARLARHAKSAAVFPVLVTVLAAASLLYFNPDSRWDDGAPYFFGAYALGMLARWCAHPGLARGALPAIVALGGAALGLQFRIPIVVATAAAVSLAVTARAGWLSHGRPRAGVLAWLGERSYSIFLVHYAVIVAFDAVWHVAFPGGASINALGMFAATLASVAAGAVLYRRVESRPLAFGHPASATALAAIVAGAFAVEALATGGL